MIHGGYSSVFSHRGSALILTVVLTSLLAIVGVLFLMTTRIDRMASSATAASRELDFALDTVMARINEALVVDIPGVGRNEEYYDYPDANNPWLADLEPYQSGTSYYWRQTSNVAGLVAGGTTDVRIRVIGERDPIRDVYGAGTTADADGDGVGDARWFEVPGVTSAKGQPIYAAVRIIDNGGMLNVNTGYKFNRDEPKERVDGKSQLQVNLVALAVSYDRSPGASNETALLKTRANNMADAIVLAPQTLKEYERMEIWGFLDPNRRADLSYIYTPFDVSDEMELRYRFLVNHPDIDTRVENWGWFKPWNNTIRTPVDSGGDKLDAWFARAAAPLDPNYAYRHLATTYNMDRILTPKPLQTVRGTKFHRKVNVNKDDQYNVDDMREAIVAALAEADPGLLDPVERATQIAVNLRDYMDDDDVVTVMPGTQTSGFYGFEQPCVYISELAYRWVENPDGEPFQSYAIELHKPYFEDKDPKDDEWQLVVNNATRITKAIDWSGTRRFHVLLAEDSSAPLVLDWTDSDEPMDTMSPPYRYDRNGYPRRTQALDSAGFQEGVTITLERKVGPTGQPIPVDFVRVPVGWFQADGVARCLQRDISPNKSAWGLWSSPGDVNVPSLGRRAAGDYTDESKLPLQAHPANRPLVNIGEVGMVFAESGYNLPKGATPTDVLVDLRNPKYARLFNYLTVMDPAEHAAPDPNRAPETRVMGRININTAPAFVLAQLPWGQYWDGASLEKARAIVRRRINGPYQSIGELMQVNELLILGSDGRDNLHTSKPAGPDVTPDTALDDLEERDLLFTRISDLVTVRSDVFTAYILVRIGTDGPQKRVVATLDRSRVNAAGETVRMVARQSVPDPR